MRITKTGPARRAPLSGTLRFHLACGFYPDSLQFPGEPWLHAWTYSAAEKRELRDEHWDTLRAEFQAHYPGREPRRWTFEMDERLDRPEGQSGGWPRRGAHR